ncbi:MAG: hypothetical protein NTU89_00655 [Candidatus Dependentiae bacterium]|nr:hypothetical protein [Candidatus Dependentiae bacterium]
MRKKMILFLLYYNNIILSSNFTKWETTPELDQALILYRTLETKLESSINIKNVDREKMLKAIGNTRTMCLKQVWPSVRNVGQIEQTYKSEAINKDQIQAAHAQAIKQRDDIISVFSIMILNVIKDIETYEKPAEPIRRSSLPKDANVTKFI